MKKHLFGFAIFSVIFASFAVAFAYFYAPPIPQIEVEEKKFNIQVENVEKTSCFKQKKSDISYKIQYTQFDTDNDQFISKMYVNWNGKGDAPKRLVVATRIYTLEKDKIAQHSLPTVFNEPFKNEREALLIVKFKVPKNIFDSNQNLYAVFNFAESFENGYNFSNGMLTEPQAVLYFHK